jgi:uncharacterized membrane protein
MSSQPKRTILKSISWETLSTTAMLGLAYWMFGNIGTCITFSIIAYFMKLGLFYVHDRCWHKVQWGKI